MKCSLAACVFTEEREREEARIVSLGGKYSLHYVSERVNVLVVKVSCVQLVSRCAVHSGQC